MCIADMKVLSCALERLKVYFCAGVEKYGGSLVDISKLMQQLEKSDNTRSNTEEKLKELQKELCMYSTVRISSEPSPLSS